MFAQNQTVKIVATLTPELNGKFGRVVGISGDFPVIGKVYLVQSWTGAAWTDHYGYSVISVPSINLEFVREVRVTSPYTLDDKEENLFGDQENLFDDDNGSDAEDIL